MTEVPNATEAPNIVEAIPSEALSYETVQTLCDQAHEAIQNDAPDRAIEILVALDKGQCQGDVQPSQKFEIVKDLWQQYPVAAQKLLSIEFQTFKITVKGNDVYCEAVRGIFEVTSFESKTTKEAQNLIDQATHLFREEEFAGFEVLLKNLLNMHAEHQISDRDLVNFICSLCQENILVAERLFPLMNEFIKVAFDNGYVKLRVSPCNNLDIPVPFRTVDTGLELIKEEEYPEERIRLYGKLAKMHESRAIEILKLAEAELPKVENCLQIEAIQELSPLYVQCKNGDGLKALTPKLEASFDRFIEDLKIIRPLSLSFHYAMIALAENDKQAFENHLSSLKQAAGTALDDEIRKGIEESLEKLEALGEKTFPTDPMVLKEQKV